MLSYFHRLAVLYWFSCLFATSRHFSACPSILVCKWLLFDLEMQGLPLGAASPSARVSFPEGLTVSCPEGLFCWRSRFYTPTTFWHLSYFEKPWAMDISAALDTVQAIAWWTPNPLMLYDFLRSSCSHLTTAIVVLCHHSMLLHADSFALAKHCVCSKSGGSWDRGNLLFLPPALRGFSPLLREKGSLSDLFYL